MDLDDDETKSTRKMYENKNPVITREYVEKNYIEKSKIMQKVNILNKELENTADPTEIFEIQAKLIALTEVINGDFK